MPPKGNEITAEPTKLPLSKNNLSVGYVSGLDLLC